MLVAFMILSKRTDACIDSFHARSCFSIKFQHLFKDILATNFINVYSLDILGSDISQLKYSESKLLKM